VSEKKNSYVNWLEFGWDFLCHKSYWTSARVRWEKNTLNRQQKEAVMHPGF